MDSRWSLADRLETLSDQPYSSWSRSTTSCMVSVSYTHLDVYKRQKLGHTVKDRSAVMAKIIASLDEINFSVEDTKIDVLGNAYELSLIHI